MLSKLQQQEVAAKAVGLMHEFEDELLALIAGELAMLEDLRTDIINDHQVGLATKIQALRQRYSDKYNDAIASAFANGFAANAASELSNGDIS